MPVMVRAMALLQDLNDEEDGRSVGSVNDGEVEIAVSQTSLPRSSTTTPQADKEPTLGGVRRLRQVGVEGWGVGGDV